MEASRKTKPRVQDVECPARGRHDGFLILRATVCDKRGPERFPHRPDVLAVAPEVAASVVAPQAKAALDMARDQHAAKGRTLDDIHGPESVRLRAHCHCRRTEGELADLAVSHSQLMQIGYQQLHLAPPSEKSSIRQRCLGSRLPGGMESIKADKQVTVGT